MTVRPIVKLNDVNDSILRSPCRKVVFSENGVHILDSLIRDMLDTLLAHPICIGLSANQIGIPLCVSIINVNRLSDDNITLINPEIIQSSGSKDLKYESCMSVPHARGLVEMRKKLTVTYQMNTGQQARQIFTGFLGRVVRHEIDHLNGVIYTDRVLPKSPVESSSAFDYESVTAVSYSESEVAHLTSRLS